MISEIFYMDGYGIYVWGSFAFTFLSFMSLFLVIKNQYEREKNKFKKGEEVSIIESKPYSKKKTWQVIDK